MIRTGRVLLIEVDFDEFVVLFAPEVLVPADLTVSTGSVTRGTVYDQIRVLFIEIRFEEVVLGGLSKIRAVARWNEVSNRLVRSIIILPHKLNRV